MASTTDLIGGMTDLEELLRWRKMLISNQLDVGQARKSLQSEMRFKYLRNQDIIYTGNHRRTIPALTQTDRHNQFDDERVQKSAVADDEFLGPLASYNWSKITSREHYFM